MAPPLNYHHLYYFFAIAKSGSIAKAADELALTPPTLSSQLKQFQRSVKCRLFERNGNALRLTAEGRVFFKYARQMFALGDQLEDHVRDQSDGLHPGIQIGVPHGLPASYTAALISHILKRHDNARVELEEGALDRLAPKMGDLRLDLVMSTERLRKLEGVFCENTLIGDVPIVFAARITNGNGHNQFLDAKKTRFLLPVNPQPSFDAIANFLNRVDRKEICVVPNRDVALSLASKGQGVAAVDVFSFNAYRPHGRLRLARVDKHPPIRESVYLATTPRKLSNPLADYALTSFRLRFPTPN